MKAISPPESRISIIGRDQYCAASLRSSHLLAEDGEPGGCDTKNTIESRDLYLHFYEELGRKYPETALSHANRGPQSRYQAVLHELERFAKKGCKMLDVGCNDGVYAIPYCRDGGKALGIDISRSLVEKGRGEAARQGVTCRFMHADIESPDVARVIGDRFDLVLFSEVLEHLRYPDSALDNIHRLLKPQGYLVLTAPTPVFGDLVPPALGYVRVMMKGEKLTESHIADTTKRLVFQQYGISEYLYRHDGYYPRAFVRYVEGFEFRRVRFYTITIRTPLLIVKNFVTRPSDSRLPMPSPASPVPEEAPVSHRLVRRLWRTANSIQREYDLLLRRIPLLNLLGDTNVGVFRKTE